jgi:hypothetical protein
MLKQCRYKYGTGLLNLPFLTNFMDLINSGIKGHIENLAVNLKVN